MDCVIGSASGMRQALAQAIHHARHRSAFGGPLVDKPAMRNVLADLAIESEAATALAMRLAGAVDRSARGDESEQAFRRLATAVGKFWVCKRQPAVVGEALECLGGNGYVEESGMPRLYRDAPLNSIWEGSGNVQALDVLRALRRSPEALDAYFAEVSGHDRRVDDAAAGLKAMLRDVSDPEGQARRVVQRMALVLQGSLLTRYSPPAVADAFVVSRLGGDWGHTFGTLPSGLDLAKIVERSAPA
jgi:putative acyl-CoA dehydrogenase